MSEALRHALAGPQRRVELRMAVVVDDRVVVVHPLDEVALAHAVLEVQRHVQGLRLGQPGPRRRRAHARRRRRHDAEAREPGPRQDRRRRLPAPADQEEQRRAAQGTQRARVVTHPRAARVHVTWGAERERDDGGAIKAPYNRLRGKRGTIEGRSRLAHAGIGPGGGVSSRRRTSFMISRGNLCKV